MSHSDFAAISQGAPAHPLHEPITTVPVALPARASRSCPGRLGGATTVEIWGTASVLISVLQRHQPIAERYCRVGDCNQREDDAGMESRSAPDGPTTTRLYGGCPHRYRDRRWIERS